MDEIKHICPNKIDNDTDNCSCEDNTGNEVEGVITDIVQEDLVEGQYVRHATSSSDTKQPMDESKMLHEAKIEFDKLMHLPRRERLRIGKFAGMKIPGIQDSSEVKKIVVEPAIELTEEKPLFENLNLEESKIVK